MQHRFLAVLAVLSGLLVPAAAYPQPAAANGALELLDEAGQPLPTYEKSGRTYVLGTQGQRYFLRIHNRTPRRVEVVASVDGRDVMDGKPAAYQKRGYLVDAWGEVTIDGFRLNEAAVAAFRFSSVRDSYAGRLGDARQVGVIGLAIFAERPPVVSMPTWRPRAPSPAEDSAGRSANASPPPAAAPSSSASIGASKGSDAAPEGMAQRSSSRLEARQERPGLGTEFGEQHASFVEHVSFERASSRPTFLVDVRYNDRTGLLALGIDLDGRGRADDAYQRETAVPFPANVSYATPPPGWR